VNELAKRHELHLVYLSTPWREKEAKHFSERCFLHSVAGVFSSAPNESLTEYSGWRLFSIFPLFVRMLIEIRRVVRAYGIDIVNAHWAVPSGFIACLACKNVPVITTLRGSDINMFGKRFFFRRLVKYTLRHSAKLTALSKSLENAAIRLGADSKKIEVIPSGVDTEMFKPIDKKTIRAGLKLENDFHVVFVGNLIPLKRVDMLVRVCARLSRRYPHVSLVIVGEGSEHVKLEKLAHDGNFENVQFTGSIEYDQMPLYMNAADVLVLPSESEGLPDVVQEAMACGIPVIASNVGGLPELITDGVNGFLVNNEVELEERLRVLMSNPDLRNKMGANAREFATRYLSIDKAVRQTEELYQAVVSEHTLRSS